jgi:hypothetical protein
VEGRTREERNSTSPSDWVEKKIGSKEKKERGVEQREKRRKAFPQRGTPGAILQGQLRQGAANFFSLPLLFFFGTSASVRQRGEEKKDLQ